MKFLVQRRSIPVSSWESWHLWRWLFGDCEVSIGSFALGWFRITFVVVDVVSQIRSLVANTWSDRSLCPSRHVCASLTWLCCPGGEEDRLTFDELSRLWRTAHASLKHTCNCSLSPLRFAQISKIPREPQLNRNSSWYKLPFKLSISKSQSQGEHWLISGQNSSG